MSAGTGLEKPGGPDAEDPWLARQKESREDSTVDSGGEDEEPSVECAMVEYVLGNVQTRKWTLTLGQTYKVGRKDSGADIEIDHESISRRHCSLALTQVESDLMLVVMDQGSSNGTFVDKIKLEKGVGLTKKVKELRFMSFGHCENGYRLIVRGEVTNAKGAAFSAKKVGSGRGVVAESLSKAMAVNKRGGPLSTEQTTQIERLKRLEGGDSEDAPASSGNRRERKEKVPQERAVPEANASGNRRERREAAKREAEGGRARSRSPAGKSKHDDQEEWKQKAAKAKQMQEDAKQRRLQASDRDTQRASAGSSRRDKSSWLANIEEYSARKTEEAKKKGTASKDPGAGAADIEWPEDWA